MATPPRLPRGLYRTPDPTQMYDYDGTACVECFDDIIFLNYRQYFDASYEPYFTELPGKAEYERSMKENSEADLLDRREYEAMIEKAIARVKSAKEQLEGRPSFLNDLMKANYDDYLSAVGVHVYETRLQLRISELDRLLRFIKPYWPYKEYPILEAGQTEYVIPECEASNLEIASLYIPDGVTLKPSPGVKAIEWSVRNIRFGRDATIDLSAPNWEPPAPRSISRKLPLAVGENGKEGEAGPSGMKGADGVSLKLKGIAQIEGTGTLWIRTDGGPGGAGGQGGAGQDAIPERRFFSRRGIGGDGGVGGPGGNGGSTSVVDLSFRTGQNPFNLYARKAQDTVPSLRPADEIKGSIIIQGAGGLGGKGGVGGPPGSGHPSGSPGQTGATGLQGIAGSLTCHQYLGDI